MRKVLLVGLPSLLAAPLVAQPHGRSEMMKWCRMALIFFLILPAVTAPSFAGINEKLAFAANQGDLTQVQSLLSQGADVNAKGAMGWTPLYMAMGHADVVKLLLEHGADANVKDFNGTPNIVSAATLGHADVVQLLLAHGAEINAQDKMGLTALMMATMGHADVVQILLEHGADVNVKDTGSGSTALISAASTGHTDIVKVLLDHGADVNAKNNAGFTALTLATMAGQEDVAKVLVEHGAVAKGMSGKAAAGNAPAQLDHGGQQMLAVKRHTSDVDKPKFATPENPNSFAVIIGVEKYTNLPAAEFAERDADAVRSNLMAMGYPARNIYFLNGQQATRAKIDQSLNTWLPKRVSDKSTVFFYYSGHGAPDPKTNQAYLVPVDGDAEDLDSTAYPLKQLYAKVGGLKARHVIVALDSCFSGAGGRSVIAKGTRPLVSTIDLGGLPSNAIALTASDKSEISGTIEEQGHGAFTYYMLKGLAGAAKNDSGAITVQSLYDYLAPKVEDAARLHNRDQTPQLLPAGSEGAGTRLR
jgi:ankyrin repeat protein